MQRSLRDNIFGLQRAVRPTLDLPYRESKHSFADYVALSRSSFEQKQHRY